MTEFTTQILKTDNLDIFTKPSYTRKIYNNAVNRIAFSITKNGFLVNPIIVNEKFEVIDGNHRVEAARRIPKTGVYFIIKKGYGHQEHMEMNNIQSNWKTEDFAKSYADVGVESYVKLKEFKEEYSEFPLYSCICLLTNTAGLNKKLSAVANRKNLDSANFEDGTWSVDQNQIDNAEYLASKLRKLKPFIGDVYRNSAFVQAWITINNKRDKNGKGIFSISRLMTKLEKYPQLGNNLQELTGSMTQGEWQKEVRDIYNFREQKSNRVNIV